MASRQHLEIFSVVMITQRADCPPFGICIQPTPTRASREKTISHALVYWLMPALESQREGSPALENSREADLQAKNLDGRKVRRAVVRGRTWNVCLSKFARSRNLRSQHSNCQTDKVCRPPALALLDVLTVESAYRLVSKCKNCPYH